MLNEEKQNKNYLLWVNSLKKYNCYSEELIERYGDKIKKGSFSMNESCGSCYEGSLLNVVLYNLCNIASHINKYAFGKNEEGKMRHEFLSVDLNSLMKVLLLQHISKALMFVPTSMQWQRDKGILYEFNKNLTTSLKLGERSSFMCLSCGINLTEEEYEAMKVCDKEEEIKNSCYVTPLAAMVKIANQLTAIEIYNKYKKENS